MDAHHATTLTIDLEALTANYSFFVDHLAGCACGAAVKADAYGCGLERVAPALAAAGCRHFFVATLDEGISARQVLDASAEIFVLNGPVAGSEAEFGNHALLPALNDLGQIERWQGPAVLHLDSGMSRLGLPPQEVAILAAEPERLGGIEIRYVMSHLSCADEPERPENAAQLALFQTLCAQLPTALVSLANSAGILLGPQYHFDLARAGIGLYGGNPFAARANPMRQVVRLQAKIAQVREIDSPQTVGYGAAHRVTGPSRIATLPVGYADGYLRSLSHQGFASIGGVRVALVGRVSMDLITLDVSALPPQATQPGSLVDLLGGDVDIDELAAAAGTISYELLTSLGQRYPRRYLGRTADAVPS